MALKNDAETCETGALYNHARRASYQQLADSNHLPGRGGEDGRAKLVERAAGREYVRWNSRQMDA